jgi:tetratricopeptide (TPR) repeat protein
MTVAPGDLPSFGTLLRAHRTHRHLTQQQLAEILGMHRHAVGRWEQGDYLPASKTVVLELARQLRLDKSETRALLEASLTALSPYWSVPLPRNAYFTGREPILRALHRQLGRTQAAALTQSSALCGLGGVGKTQIALEYAYQHALDYSGVFWLGAETEEQMVSSLLRIAEVLRLPERDDQDQQRVLAAVRHWLGAHGQWLLIVDNVEDLTLLDRVLPTIRSGALLLTTRCQTLGTRAYSLDLAPMRPKEGLLFLLRRAKLLVPEAGSRQVRQFAQVHPTSYRAATELVEALGALPLALDQAGAYLEATHCGVSAYLKLFQTQRAPLLASRGEGTCDHPESVSTTFQLAITRAAQHHCALRDLLRVCAFLQADAIPEELFRQGSKHLGAKLSAVSGNELQWNQLLACACGYSLLERQPEQRTLSLHRLVQAVLLESMSLTERGQWSKCVLRALDAAFPEVLSDAEYPAWQQCERLLPHALSCLHWPEAEKESLVLASLAHRIAQYLRASGRYVEAEPLYQRSLHIREQALGPDHPQVATVLSSLASLYRDQGKYVEAEALYQRVLHVWEQSTDPDDLQAATTLTYLASLYVEQGKYIEAEPLHQRALHIREQALGLDDLQVAHSLNALAVLYRRQGNYEQAASLLQRALHIREQALGPEHPNVASPLYNLANLALEQDNYNRAEPLFQRALHIWEQALGPEHPHLASPLQELAKLFLKQQKYTQAKPLFQQALSLRERHLGPCHPETAQTLHDLAIFYHEQGNFKEACALAERALTIRSQALGATHPRTLDTRDLHARLLQAFADPDLAIASAGSAEPLKHRFKVALNGQHLSNVLDQTDDSIHEFLCTCCELHPRAWCRVSELWQAYEYWATAEHRYIPLPRRTFAAQLKARGCHADRTNTARIWRGVTLVQTSS